MLTMLSGVMLISQNGMTGACLPGKHRRPLRLDHQRDVAGQDAGRRGGQPGRAEDDDVIGRRIERSRRRSSTSIAP